MLLEILFYSFVIMLASLSGLVLIWKSAGKFLTKNLPFFVSFSAGVFLVLAYQLSLEALELAPSLGVGIAFILSGIIGTWVLFRSIPSFHHHHASRHERAHSRLDARRILFGDAVHNVVDGILLVAAFSASAALGMITVLSIFIHELVQEVSEFFVLKESGFSTTQALGVNFLVSSTILIGALGSFFLLREFAALEVVLLGFAAGSFLLVVFYDLIPHSIRRSETQTQYTQHITWFIVGVVLMAGVTMIGADTHVHSGGSHEHGTHEHGVHDHE